MLASLILAVLHVSVPIKDTVVTLGIVERDLTGDGAPELLSLTGTGVTIDSLEVTFTISSFGDTLYVDTWSMTRTVGFDRGRRVLTDAQLQTRLKDFGGWFFEDSKFMTPDQFVAWLSSHARLHIAEIPNLIARDRKLRGAGDSLTSPAAAWEAIRAAPVTVFQYSAGGDAITAIVWSPTDQRFYDIFNCC